MAFSKIISISNHQRWVLQQHFCCMQASTILAGERIQIQTTAYPALCLGTIVGQVMQASSTKQSCKYRYHVLWKPQAWKSAKVGKGVRSQIIRSKRETPNVPI